MSWLDWHKESERFASEAHLLMRRGDVVRARDFFLRAAEAENQALLSLDATKVRTLGIITVSAVSLLFKAGSYSEAESLTIKGLAANNLPPFAEEQLKSLLQAVWNSKAMETAGVSFLPGQVMVSVKGGEVIVGGAPLDLIVEKVQTVQALFYRTIEFMKGSPHRKRGAPSAEIQDACRPWLLQAPAGSYQFSVAIQEPKQADFFRDAGPKADQVALHFMSILKAASEDPEQQLQELVPEEDYRSTFLKLARSLAPTGKQFSQLEVRSAGDIQGIALRPENRKSINQVLRAKTAVADSATETHVELKGVLRGLHLEKDWLEVLVEGEVLHVDGLNEAIDDVIGPMVNRRVVVQTKKDNKGRLRFVDIERDD